MLVNFLLMCLTVLTLPHRNPELARAVRVIPSRRVQVPLALLGVVLLGAYLVVHVWKDLTTPVDAWYFHSTPIWLAVMALATVVYLRERRLLRARGVDVDAIFAKLPPE